MKKNYVKKLISSVFSLAAISAFFLAVTGCSGNDAAEGNYARIVFTQGTGDSVYYFDIPYGEDEIYAEKTTAKDDSSLTAYKIQCKNGYEDPFQALEILFVPEQINAQGSVQSASLTAVFYDRLLQNGSSNTSDIYQNRTFVLDSSKSFSSENYRISSVKDGKIFLNWQVNDENSITCETDYTDGSVNRYNMKGLTFMATIK